VNSRGSDQKSPFCAVKNPNDRAFLLIMSSLKTGFEAQLTFTSTLIVFEHGVSLDAIGFDLQWS
jgi:hypothetical protein